MGRGGGSGGRLACHYKELYFAGEMKAYGGLGTRGGEGGAAGTIFLQLNAADGNMTRTLRVYNQLTTGVRATHSTQR